MKNGDDESIKSVVKRHWKDAPGAVAMSNVVVGKPRSIETSRGYNETICKIVNSS
jgi:hypothetical protein